MPSVKLHARLLAILLLALGVGSILYQVLVQEVPLRQTETDPVWVVDAQVSFNARSNAPVKARMYVPPLTGDFTALNESFISNNFGVNVDRDKGNRWVTWSARRAGGQQVLYYRLMITPRFAGPDLLSEEGPQFRSSPELSGPEKVAADALLKPIREQSADVETFISETIKRANDIENDNVRLLLGGDPSPENRARAVTLLLAEAHIPAETVHTIKLENATQAGMELWLRTFNGQKWLYFNPVSGKQGLPDDQLVWWSGDKPLLELDGGSKSSITVGVHRNEMGALELAKSLRMQGRDSFINQSLYQVPVSAQQLLKVILMIPIGVLLVLLIRSVIGLETLGTFTPVLVALAFRETQVVWGAMLFTGITALGLILRSYLDHLKLQHLARLSVVLTFVILTMALISVLSYRLGLATGLSVALFPMVILTMMIERVSIVWEERGGPQSVKIGLITLATAILCHAVMIWEPLVYFVFTFPGVLLVLAAFMVFMGHYRGYRLLELVRFRALVNEG